MKKTLLIAGALLALTASMASAQGGINLSWTDCGVAGLAAKTFACTNNSGSDILVVSAVSPAPMNQLVAAEIVIDLQSNQAVLSDWWSLTTGTGCRPTSLSGLANFATLPGTCLDTWSGAASGGIDYTFQFGAPNRGRIRGVWAVPGTSPATSDGASEYYIEELILNHAKTVGTGSCAGCGDGACIVLNSIKLSSPSTAHQDYTVSNPLNRAYVTYQAGGVDPSGGCPGATPTRNSTWGSVKSLYR
jgi:hypothetical protein